MPLSTQALVERFKVVRNRTTSICEPLSVEDHLLQCTAETSPAKWHLAHTTWFFETFVLRQCVGMAPFHKRFNALFNSYYESVGSLFDRSMRGDISRPSLETIKEYRYAIDEKVLTLLANAGACTPEIVSRIELGLHHEEQHQELILMDIKRNFSINPMAPVYRDNLKTLEHANSPMAWKTFDEGLHHIGHTDSSFAFDNETPKHKVFVHAFKLATRTVNNADWLEFIDAGGYHDPLLWLSDGWAWRQQNNIESPLYWTQGKQGWSRFCLRGELELAPHAPLCHISYYEADAYARWLGKRLPTEAEWEIASQSQSVEGNFLENEHLAPTSSLDTAGALNSLFGNVWEITQSTYSPYPGFKALDGSLGEYNEQFMSNQTVLRGGSCLTPKDHIRSTYRNFFYPHQRWAMQGLRLADS